MAIKPLRNLLYIIPLTPEPISSILHIPDSSQNDRRVNQGIVKYRGPRTSGEIEIGDHVIFSGYSGDEMVDEEEGSLYVMLEDDIEAIFDDEAPGAYLVSLDNVKLLIAVAAAEVSSQETDESKKRFVDLISRRVQEQVDHHFMKSLYF